jgi:hypothetical protein
MKTVLWFSTLLVVLGPTLPAEDIVLVDGRYIQVKCLEATETRVKVILLETGGEVWIPWSLIREEDRKRLRIRFGLEEDESEKALFEEGVKVVTQQADEYLGVPVAPLDLQSLPESFEIWHQGKKWEFKKALIRSVEPAQVPALTAYSAQQLYERKLTEIKPQDDDLEGHWDLARYCMAIDHYDRAAAHLLKVKEIDAEFETERVSNHLARMEALARDQARSEAIKNAKLHAQYNRFERARADLAQILSLPDLSPVLKAHAEQVKQWVEVKRAEHFKAVVRREYFALLNTKIGKMSRDPKLKLKDAQKELRSNLHKEIVADIASKHGLDQKNEVQKWWEERVVNAPFVSSYGSGTFIVLGPAPGARERDQQLQQAMARAAAQQRNQGGRNNQQGSLSPEMMKFPKPPTPDEWWEKDYSDSAARADWMKAYYAEQCKMLKVTGERREDCARCAATATVKFGGTQGETIAVTCPRCHGHKYDKGVAYK